ncbi:MAG TPA: hypothetical protein VJ697_14245 [Nitrososphaeraceae archaeon]|nr:hypothetical protein [Nitrososphaeraceae archaeon]
MSGILLIDELKKNQKDIWRKLKKKFSISVEKINLSSEYRIFIKKHLTDPFVKIPLNRDAVKFASISTFSLLIACMYNKIVLLK